MLECGAAVNRFELMSTNGRELWLAVKTKSRQEAVALENLNRQGFNTYLPRLLIRKHVRNQWRTLSEPLFPGYMFLLVDPSVVSLSPVRSTLGVTGLVTFGHQLIPIPDDVISFIKMQEDAAAGAEKLDQLPFASGDKVQVLEGPFAGLLAVYEMANAKDRAMLLITFMGRQNRIAMPFNHIIPAP